MKQTRLVIMGLLAAGSALPHRTHGGDLGLSRQSCDGGGVMHSTAGDVELSGTIAQHDAGAMTGGSLQLTGGFWFSLAHGDCNSDGGVNLLDYADWSTCLFGPDGTHPTQCTCFDLDNDGDIDLFDAAELQISFLGN